MHNNRYNIIFLVIACSLTCSIACGSLAHGVAFSPHKPSGCVAGIPHADGGDPTKNDAIVDVCSNSACPAGAMWINGYPAGKYNVSEYITKTVSEAANTVDIYLQGALVYNDSSTNPDYNGKTITTYGLTLCREGTKGCNKSLKGHRHTVPYITQKDLGTLNRGTMPKTGWSWINHWAAKKVKLTINVNTMKNTSGVKHSTPTINGETCDQYRDRISIIRDPSTDPNGAKPGAGASTALDTSDIILNICPDPVTTYVGKTEIYDGTTEKDNNWSVDNIAANSKKVKFIHSIKRNNDGPSGADTEKYYVNASESGSNLGSKDDIKSKSFSINSGYISVHEKEVTVNLAPGQSKQVWQTLHYESDSEKTAPNKVPNITCTLMKNNDGSNIGGRACVQFARDVARFTASIGAKIKANGSTFAAPSSSDPLGTKITTNDGSFAVRFTNTIDRKNSTQDKAGGTASALYHSSIKTGSASGTEQVRSPSSGDGTTEAISTGGTTTPIAESNNFTYTGTLKYGETRKICNVLSYTSIVKYGDNTWSSEDECYTVYRENKKCAMDTSSEFGVSSGENIGRISATNASLPSTLSSANTMTSSTPSLFNSSNSYTQTGTIWARPGDSIRFKHEGCAGGAYAVNNSSLNNTTYKSTYTSSGNLYNYSGSTLTNNNKNGYLFGETIPNKTSNNPLTYSNTRSWDSSTATNGNFMSGEDNQAELSKQSPSDSSITTYNQNSYNAATYSCDTNYYSFIAGHYQIAGSKNTGSCNAYTKTATASDVGHIITQSLVWNHVKVTNGTVASGYNQNYTAKANVKIPYNYKIQSAVYNSAHDANNKVAYLGGTAKFVVDLHVLPRANKAFGDDTTYNNYATITKKTNVIVTYYYKRGSSTWHARTLASSTQSASEDKRIRLNVNGRSTGTGNNDGLIENGGYHYGTFDALVDDTDQYLMVGDQICASVEVWPMDSHDDYNNDNNLSGAGTNNIALSETGSSSKAQTRTSCYTIAKKPTISIEGANAYAGGDNGFLTSRYNKQFGDDTNKYTFGSWSEYGVYGRVAITGGRGIASGATFGYATGSNRVAINGARSNSGYVAKSLDGNSCSNNSNNSTTVFSTQTFTNTNCDATSIGRAGIGKDQATHFRDRIRDRFYSPSSAKESEPNKEAKKRCMSETYRWNNNYCEGDDGRNYYSGISAYGKVRIGDSDYMNMDNYINSKFDENGVNHTYFRSNAYLGRGSSFLTLWASHNFGNNQEYVDKDTGERYPNRNFTRLIQVTNDQHNATLIIDSNIKVGNYETENPDPVLHNTGEIVQFVIIADKVKITSRVSQIDAIIIADEVDTCAYDSVSDMAKDIRVVLGSADFDANTCDNQLLFRAPVLTNKLILNRTFGASYGTESIKRAEIFDLNPYTYLWSYGQMSRYSQAVTTYSREMPSRY